MADFESALSELGAALTATDTKLSSSLAEILGVAIQELIEAELADGTVEAGPDDWASEADVELRRTPEGWRIAEVTTRSDDRCALG